MKQIIKKTAWDASLYYLGIRSRSEHEIRSYLKKKDYATEEIEDCIQRLYELDILNDSKFAEEYLKHAIDTNMSKMQFISKLNQFGLKKEVLNEIIAKYKPSDEYRSAEVLFRKYLKQFQSLEKEKIVLKIKQRLFSKGFSYSVISQVLSRNNIEYLEEDTDL